MADPELVLPDWHAPPAVRACATTRRGGVGVPPFDDLNLALHVGDEPEAVLRNRALLSARLPLPREPVWLEQVHGREVADADQDHSTPPVADAAVATRPGRVCAVLTADCLPVLFCDRAATVCAAAHAGWRGLHAGVLEATVARLGVEPGELLVWLGPAIGPARFEVGPEVRAAFLERDVDAAGAFRPGQGDRWLGDLYALARLQLAGLGVADVSGGEYCTAGDPARFFSYRREGRTGRMASLIWLERG